MKQLWYCAVDFQGTVNGLFAGDLHRFFHMTGVLLGYQKQIRGLADHRFVPFFRVSCSLNCHNDSDPITCGFTGNQELLILA